MSADELERESQQGTEISPEKSVLDRRESNAEKEDTEQQGPLPLPQELDEKQTTEIKEEPSKEENEVKKEETGEVTDKEEDKEDEEEEEEEEDIETETVRQTHVCVIPSYASWFDMGKVHRIERESLPEFFSSGHPSKSPQIYVNYRNFMVNAYRLNPNEYLTLTACRRNLVGDVGTIMRVHRFLNKWGLINYQVNPSIKPGYAVEKMPNGAPMGLPNTSDFFVNYDTPRGIFAVNNQRNGEQSVDVDLLKKLMGEGKKQEGDETNVKNGTAETTPKEDVDDRKEKHDEPQKKRQKVGDGWTVKDMSRLVLAVKEHKDDWYKIAKAVGNKSPQECILKLLKLPIEDNFNDIDDKDLGVLKYSSTFPLSSLDNPIIGNLAYMAQLVDSDTARAASGRACKIMDINMLKKIHQVYGNDLIDGEGNKVSSTSKTELSQQSKEHENEKAAELPTGNVELKDKNISEVKQEKTEANEKEKHSVGSSPEQNKEHDEQQQKQSGSQEEKNEFGSTPSVNGGKPALAENENLDDLQKEKFEQEILKESESDTDPLAVLKDSANTALGIAGSRSHLFANYEERELHKLTCNLVNNQLAKVELKLKKVDELEKAYEKERKLLAQQQQDVLIDRLSLTKSSIEITKKLQDASSLLKLDAGNHSLSDEKFNDILSEVDSMLYSPTKQSMEHVSNDNKPEASSDEDNKKGGLEDPSVSNDLHKQPDNTIRPLSIDSPQTFKVWVS